MPELPEVETIRQGLKEKIVNKKIVHLTVNFKKGVKSDLKEFSEILVGNSIKDIDRVGKLLIFELKHKEKFLLVHLKMTGQLIFCLGDKIVAGGHSLPKLLGCLPNKYSRVEIEFADHSHLFFNDMRKFGYLKLVNKEELDIIIQAYGIEPLRDNFKVDRLTEIFKKRHAPVKAVLLDQKVIAGIGNIYADEILFASHVLPNRPASSLSKEEIKAIYNSAQAIIKKAIKYRGTTFNDYADADGNKGNFVKFLKVYGRTNNACPGCKGGVIKKMKVAGRGTHYCSQCQK